MEEALKYAAQQRRRRRSKRTQQSDMLFSSTFSPDFFYFTSKDHLNISLK